MPEPKEPWFFAEELHENAPPRPSGMPRTLREYAAWFEQARPEQQIGEASTYYLWSQTAAANIARVIPQAKIVAVLREPASFLASLHLQLLEVYVEDEPDLRRGVEVEPERRRGRVPRPPYLPQLLIYSGYIDYAAQLRRYHELFGREQVKVLIYDDYRADNEGVVREVCRFIGVDDSLAFDSREVNPTVAPRSQRLSELVQTVGVGRGPLSTALKEMIKSVTPAGPRRKAMYEFKRRFVFGPPPAADEELMHELRVRFAGKVQEISEYLDRDLVALWGYDRL
jgi:hypothetical protein